MSHYTVAVITNENVEVEELLEQYNERIEVAPYIDQKAEEIKKEYEENKDDAINKPESWAYKERKKGGRDYSKMSLEEFKKEFYGEDAMFDENGNMLSTYNESSKWDWYVIGGRWKNLLRVKSSSGGGRADTAPIKEVDWEALNRITKKDVAYGKRFWEINVLGKKETKAERASGEYSSMYKKEYYIERYGNVEKFVKIHGIFSTFAVVTPDGEWNEKGKMGWWASSSETPEEANAWAESWYETFVKPYLKSKEEFYITIVDCHI